MAGIQQDIDIFLNRAQQKIAALGNEARVMEDGGYCVDSKIDLILKLSSAISILQEDDGDDLTDDEIWQILSYWNKEADLITLPLGIFDSSCLVDTVFVGAGYLQGPTGPQGPQGPIGPQGEQGPAGEDGEDGEDGNSAWTAIYAIESDGERRVLKVTGWTGGTGTEPATGSYLGPSGYVLTAAEATDIRGAVGPQGPTGNTGATGATGASSYTYVAYANDTNGNGFTLTFSDSFDYIAIRTTSSPISIPSASDFTGLWKKYKGEPGAAFQVNASGTLADRTLYDSQATPFWYLATDTGNVYFKQSNAAGDWSDPISFVGDKGWTPIPAIVADDERRVLQVVNWTGGEGTSPSVDNIYIGPLGIVDNPGDAVDIRGPQGEEGPEGPEGPQGTQGPAGNGLTADCRVATTEELTATYDSGDKTLTADSNGAISIDDISLSLNDRVLVKDQSTATDNGIYYVTQVGSVSTPWILTRAEDYNTSVEYQKFWNVFVKEGTDNAGTHWGMPTERPGLVLDTTELQFVSSWAVPGDLYVSGSVTALGSLTLGNDATLFLGNGLIDAPLGSILMSDAQLYVFNNGDTTTKLRFEVSAVPTGTTVTLTAPSASGTIATEGYVDARLLGLKWKISVVVATTANITLSGEQTIDGILTSNSRVLVKDQTDQTQNGIYVSSSGAWTRATDADSAAELEGAAVLVQKGSTNADKQFTQNADDITLGATNIVWALFSGGGSSTFADNLFRVQDNGDATKQLAVEVSGVTTATTRTWTVQDKDITVAGINNETFTGTTTFNGAIQMLNTGTPAIAFDIFSSTSVRLGAGFGSIRIEPATVNLNTTTIIQNTSASNNITISAGSTANSGVIISRIGSVSVTSGTPVLLATSGTFQPSSGTATFACLSSTPTINQTGTASGTVRGIYYNPTVTSVLGTHYAIETTAGDWRMQGYSGTISCSQALTVQSQNAFQLLSTSSGITLQSNTGSGVTLNGTNGNSTGDYFGLKITSGISTGAGTKTFKGVQVNSVIANSSNPIHGFYYSPTGSTTGPHYAFESTVGEFLVAGRFQTSSSNFESLLPFKLKSYTVAGVPSAATSGAGSIIYVTDESGGAVPAFSDGTDWRRVTDRTVIS